jgi:hypothetical protein
MKKMFLIIPIIVVILIVAYYFQPINMDKINNCSSASDCVIVKAGFCGGGLSINKNYTSLWERHLKSDYIKNSGVMCKPMMPLSSFTATCTQGKCEAATLPSEVMQ